MRARNLGTVLLALGVIATSLAPAVEAAGIQPRAGNGPVRTKVSSISNKITVSSAEFSPGDTVSFHTETTFGNAGLWNIPTNPYTSNYQVSVNWSQFERPFITRAVGVTDAPFTFVASDSHLSGHASWQYYSGCCHWFFIPETWELDFTAKADNYFRDTRFPNYHGQNYDTWDSAGPGVIVTTKKK